MESKYFEKSIEEEIDDEYKKMEEKINQFLKKVEYNILKTIEKSENTILSSYSTTTELDLKDLIDEDKKLIVNIGFHESDYIETDDDFDDLPVDDLGMGHIFNH